MLSKNTKDILLELIKEGTLTLSLDVENIDKELRGIFNCDTSHICTSMLEAFDHGYIQTYDNVLTEDNFKKPNIKTLILNIDKIFNDDILKDYTDYKKVMSWYEKANEDISTHSKIALFLAHLEATGYESIKHSIEGCMEKIRLSIEDMKGNPQVRFDYFSIWYEQLWANLEQLPDSYEYAQKYFTFKYYLGFADRNKSSIFSAIGRNDICPCGSGKKYKKCCGI